MTTPEPTELELADQLQRISPTPLDRKIAAAFPGVVVRKDRQGQRHCAHLRPGVPARPVRGHGR